MSTLLTKYDVSNYGGDTAISGNQAFSICGTSSSFINSGSNNSADTISFYLSKTGNPTGVINAYIFTANLSKVLKSDNYTIGTSQPTLTGSDQLVTFTFSGNFNGQADRKMSDATEYYVGVEYLAGSASDVINVGYGLFNLIPNSHYALEFYFSGFTSWSTEGTTSNVVFYLYQASTASTTNAGFLQNFI